MKYANRGYFGIILAIGSAFAITNAMRDNYTTAVVIGVLTVVGALAVFLTVDRKRSSRS